MVPGFNHNILYKGVLFHIQTEDSGVGKPQITTLLYRDGTIIASKKTDYSDIVRVEMLEKVVEDLMKEQHKEMLRRLKAGEFDDRAFPSSPAKEESRPETPPSPHADVDKTASVSAHDAEKPSRQPQSLDEIILEYLISEND